ncbi:MAG: flavodoxin family protein [Verrucomicrobiales bacterium]|nr:flavodoxin family protein [Verrucomicrobiales bacterium]
MTPPPMTRRDFCHLTSGATATATTLAMAAGSVLSATHAVAAEPPTPRRDLVLGVACSPRPGKTTATAVAKALEGVKEMSPQLQTELIDLGGRHIAGWSPQPVPDDFDAILPKLKDPRLAGLIIGSPCYFRSLSSLCKAFIERCMPLRDPVMVLADKPIGALAVSGNRNGGQELVIQQIHAGMISYGMFPVGGQPPAMLGGTLWNNGSETEDLSNDKIGLDSARLLGRHVGQWALRLA